LRSPLFFLLVDSWLESAGCAGVVVLEDCEALVSVEVPEAAGCVVLESVEVPFAAGCVLLDSLGVPEVAGCDESAGAGAGSAAGVDVAGGLGRAFGLPGVMVSIVAELPTPAVGATAAFGCKPKPMVSSPDSLAGIMVGAPL